MYIMNKIILILIIIIIIAIVILLANTYLTREQGQAFSFTGIIAEINQDSLVLQDNVTALIDENTEFIKMEDSDMLPYEVKTGSGPSIFTKYKVLFSDLEIGNRITAISDSNIRGKLALKL